MFNPNTWGEKFVLLIISQSLYSPKICQIDICPLLDQVVLVVERCSGKLGDEFGRSLPLGFPKFDQQPAPLSMMLGSGAMSGKYQFQRGAPLAARFLAWAVNRFSYERYSM